MNCIYLISLIEYLNGSVMLFLTTGFDIFDLVAVSSAQLLKDLMVADVLDGVHTGK